jgi:HD-GYP domain-containing protein (c-di-GMP phosphodiesterase class II)
MGGFNEDRAVAQLAEILALECGVHPITAGQIKIAAALHDIGKLLLPESILNKPTKLTAEEFEIMKTHTVLGAKLFSHMRSDSELSEMVQNVCLYHHEFWDNSKGYWNRRTDNLPLYVPITAIADVYVALLHDRPYKPAWSQQDAMEYISKQAGTQFSPQLVKVFLSLIRNDCRIPAILYEGRV